MRSIAKKFLTFILTLTAKVILARYKPRVIAVTGSVGKTSTKDAIYAALRSSGSVRRSEKSFNSELGVPLSIIGADSGWNSASAWASIVWHGLWLAFGPTVDYPKTLVLEVGADRPGDIRKIASWLRPHIVVITRLPDVPVHIEFFPTLESLMEEKFSLAEFLRKDGTLVLNADDLRVMLAKERFHARTITYGIDSNAIVRASNIKLLPPMGEAGEDGGLAFKLEYDGKSLPVVLPNVFAESFASVILAALAVAYANGTNILSAIESLRDYETPPGRVHLVLGKKSSLIIDDTYNSSPAACEAGLEMLGRLPFGKRKIAILGDMLELGRHTDEAHREIGMLAKEHAGILIAVGQRGRQFAEGAREAGMDGKKIFEAENAAAAAALMDGMLRSGDVIYIKGSQGMRMENTVLALMAEPERASELLVRQDAEWNKK